MAERKVSCPSCANYGINQKEKCFEETLEDSGFRSYLCFHCGYTSNSEYYDGSEKRDKMLETTALIVKQLEVWDNDRQLYWYPSVLNMGMLGIIYPEGTQDEWVWRFAKVIEIPENEQHMYLDEKGEPHKHRLDVEGATTYGKFDFFTACKDMGIITDQKLEVMNGS